MKVPSNLGDQIHQVSVLKICTGQTSKLLDAPTSAKEKKKRNKKQMNKFNSWNEENILFKLAFDEPCNEENILFKHAFDEPWNSNDVMELSGNLHITRLIGSKLDGKQFEGYLCHSSTLKPSGK